MFGSLGWQELLIIFAILALLFGGARVADLGGSIGRGIREFRKEAKVDDEDGEKDAPKAAKAAKSEPSAAASKDDAPKG